MYHQTIFGMPRRCPNRTCRHPFYKESHLGWLPKSEVQALAIMRCPKCRDTFAVVQLLSMVHEYKEKLPADPRNISLMEGPITLAEVNRMRKKLDTEPNPLSLLFEGRKPGASAPPEGDD